MSNLVGNIVNLDFPIKTHFTGSKIIIWDLENGNKLFRFGYYGRPIGVRKPKGSYTDRPFELTVLEALYLLNKKLITIEYKEKLLEEKEFKNFLLSLNFNLLEDLYFVYADLRNKNYILKPGLKFGSDFSVYKKGPGIDHAPFLIRVFPRGSKIIPLDLVSAGRLANSVKKKYVMASVISEIEIKYYEFKWTKP
jgi:tRNA-intron endonuclease